MKIILQKILALLARAACRRYKPIIIGVTGSVGKTSAREAIFAVLKTKYRVRRSEKNYNTEIGLPLTILGLKNYGKNPLGWLYGIVASVFRLFASKRFYPEILVLEMGADRPGDIKYLCRIVRPSIAVITAIGEIPAHVEFFAGPLEVAEEKAELFKALPVDGYAIYNADDEALLEVKDKTAAHKISFGFGEDADIRISNYALRVAEKDGADYPEGISFKLERAGNVVPVRLYGAFGKPHAYAAAAAAAVAGIFKMNLVEVSRALETYEAGPGRGRLIRGIKGSLIIDDSYNASPESMRAGLELFQKLPAKRKIAVLGDMLEIGKYTEEAHRAIGDYVSKFVDVLVTVGGRAKFIADEAMTRGVEKNSRTLGASQVFIFDDAFEAGRSLDPIIRSGDVIFVKGSRAMHLEKTVEEIMAEPEKADILLVR